MAKASFLKNFAASIGICTGAAAVFGGGAALLAGGFAAATAPVVIAAAATAGLATAGVLAVTQFVLAPLAELLVGIITIFAGARMQESDKAADRGFAVGTGVSAALSAAVLVAASVQGVSNNNTAQQAERGTQSAAFNCAANENRVEQIVTGADGKRTMTVTCQPK